MIKNLCVFNIYDYKKYGYTINPTWTHDIMEIDCIGRVKFLVIIDLVKYAGM